MVAAQWIHHSTSIVREHPVCFGVSRYLVALEPLGFVAWPSSSSMELGERPIPELSRRTDIEIMSGRERETEPAVATDGGTVVETAAETESDVRPDDCDCIGELDDDGLGCWPCYRAGFTTVNPDAEADDGDEEVSE